MGMRSRGRDCERGERVGMRSIGRDCEREKGWE